MAFTFDKFLKSKSLSAFDIKSDPSKIKENECKIIIDTREAGKIQAIVNDLQMYHDRHNIAIETLTVGDYHILSSDGQYEVVIELKMFYENSNDLIASLIDKRLEYQLPELSNYDDSILMIVCQDTDIYNEKLYERLKNFKFPESPVRFFTSLAFKKNPDGGRPSIIPVRDLTDVCISLDKIATMIEKGELFRSRPALRKKYTKKTNMSDPYVLRNVRLNIIAEIPGIGVDRAKKILDHFNWDFIKLISASAKDIEETKGIGKIFAKRTHETFNSQSNYS